MTPKITARSLASPPGLAWRRQAPARAVVKSRGRSRTLTARRIEIGFEDGDLALAQARNLGGILVDAGDLMAEVGKASSGTNETFAGVQQCR